MVEKEWSTDTYRAWAHPHLPPHHLPSPNFTISAIWGDRYSFPILLQTGWVEPLPTYHLQAFPHLPPAPPPPPATTPACLHTCLPGDSDSDSHRCLPLLPALPGNFCRAFCTHTLHSDPLTCLGGEWGIGLGDRCQVGAVAWNTTCPATTQADKTGDRMDLDQQNPIPKPLQNYHLPTTHKSVFRQEAPYPNYLMEFTTTFPFHLPKPGDIPWR